MLPTRCAGSPAWVAALAALILGACSLDGGVSIELRWPEDPELSPVLDQVAEIALVRSAAGEPPVRTVRQVSRATGEPIDMGRIEAGQGLRLAVELRSTTQRLLGYGRSAGVIDLAPGDSIEVPVEVRRPFVYVTGNTDIDTFDPTRDAVGAQYQGAIGAVANAAAAVPRADGSALVVAVPDAGNAGAWVLRLLSTSDHSELLGEPIALPYRPVELAVSASSRYVVAAHEDGPGGITVVDLQAAAGNETTFVELGPVGRVAVAPVAAGSREERAFALVDRSLDCEADSTSRVVAVALDEPSRVGPSLPYLSPIQDLATSPSSPALVVANRCEQRVERVTWEGENDEVLRLTLAQIDNVTAVAVLDTRVWAVGAAEAEEDGRARLLVASMDIDGQDVTYAELPPLQERAKTPQFSGDGGESLRQIGADELAAHDLAVLPGSEFVALITRGRFHELERGEAVDVITGEVHPILPEIEIWNYEYVLVNTATLTLVQRVRTDCDLEVVSQDALIEDWVCSQSPEQDIAGTLYEPTTLSVLYGAR